MGDNEREDVGADVAASATGAVIGSFGGPLGAVAGAAASPIVARVIRTWFASRERRAEFVIEKAAELAGIDAEQLLGRFRTEDEQEFVLRLLRAAEDAGGLDRLLALSASLASAAQEPAERLDWHKACVKALGDLDAPHFRLLERFTLSLHENNLGAAVADTGEPMRTMNSDQLERALPGVAEWLPNLTAGLEAHGLLVSRPSAASPLNGGDSGATYWTITLFGLSVLNHLRRVGELFQPGN